MADPNKIKAPGVVDKVLAAALTVPVELGIIPSLQIAHSYFRLLLPYENEPLRVEANDVIFRLGIMQQIPCAAPGLATTYLVERQVNR